MDYYNRLNSTERSAYDNYTARLNQSREAETPQTTSRSNLTQRLPKLNSFSSFLNKPKDSELIPTPLSTSRRSQGLKNRQFSAKSKKKTSEFHLNGKFYTENGLNLKHPALAAQIRKILKLVDKHQTSCHTDLVQTDFTILRRHFA
jgi:hypothetical protein